jgi:pyrroline-5-carboxylate reductase
MHERVAVGFIGIGAMATVMIKAHYRYSDEKRYAIFAASRNRNTLTALERRHAEISIRSQIDLVKSCSVVFVCVPPSAYLPTIDEVAEGLTEEKILVCITNGVSLSEVSGRVPAQVVKVIPSIAHEVGRGVALVCPGPRALEHSLITVESFLRSFSKPMRVADADMRVATNITGCGPALIATFVEALAAASHLSASSTPADALATMARETLIATAGLVDAGHTPSQIIADVATGGGMTEVAVKTLSTSLPSTLEQMTKATIARETRLKRSTEANHGVPRKGGIQ